MPYVIGHRGGNGSHARPIEFHSPIDHEEKGELSKAFFWDKFVPYSLLCARLPMSSMTPFYSGVDLTMRNCEYRELEAPLVYMNC